jgi:hypothetical protein
MRMGLMKGVVHVHDEVYGFLKAKLPVVLQHADSIPRERVWGRALEGAGDSDWHGEKRQQELLTIHQLCPHDLAQEFEQIMKVHYPEHLGHVGTESLAGGYLGGGALLDTMVRGIWKRHGTLGVAEEAVESLISEFGAFLDSPSIRVRYMAPIINLHIRPRINHIDLPGDLAIHELTDGEVTALVSEDPSLLHWYKVPRYAFVGEFDEVRFSPGSIRHDGREGPGGAGEVTTAGPAAGGADVAGDWGGPVVVCGVASPEPAVADGRSASGEL